MGFEAELKKETRAASGCGREYLSPLADGGESDVLKLPPRRPVLWPLRPIETAEIADDVLNDGRRRITIRHAELAGMTPPMLAWWFGHIVGDMEYAGSIWPRYLVWHPLDHISYDIIETPVGGHVVVRGSRIRVREAFQRRTDYLLDQTLTVERLDDRAAVIVKRVLGASAVRLTNEFEATSRGTLYVTRMEIGSLTLLKAKVIPGEQGLAWARHHVEEIGYLEHFLPALYAAEGCS
jgi:hypothetical protein